MLRDPPSPALPRLYDPARDAARLLGWFGLTVLMVGAPLVGVLSRHALLVLLPVGIGILAAAYVLSVSHVGLRTFRQALVTPLGLCSLFLAGWMALSIGWTPFPEEASPRFAAAAATVLAAAMILAHLPERRARPYLYLLPAGVAATAAATLMLALFGPTSFRGGTEFDPSLLERSVLTLVVLLWPAIGALAAFARWRTAAVLAALVAGTLVAADARLAMAVFAGAALTFFVATSAARGTAKAVAIAFVAQVVLAPAIPFLLAPLARALPGVGASTAAAMDDWRSLVASDLPRLVTGHGLDEARLGAAVGFLPPHTPRTIFFEVWYDLGVLGAVALAALFALAPRAAGGTAPHVAPALLGGMAAVLAIIGFGIATADLWFVTLVCLQAIAFGLLVRSSRNARPHASADLHVQPAPAPAAPQTPLAAPSKRLPPNEIRA